MYQTQFECFKLLSGEYIVLNSKSILLTDQTLLAHPTDWRVQYLDENVKLKSQSNDDTVWELLNRFNLNSFSL